MLRRFGIAALDAVLPPYCLTCEAAVEVQGTLCADCFRGLTPITAPLCRICGVPFRHAGQATAGGLVQVAPRAGPLSPRPAPRCATTMARSG